MPPKALNSLGTGGPISRVNSTAWYSWLAPYLYASVLPSFEVSCGAGSRRCTPVWQQVNVILRNGDHSSWSEMLLVENGQQLWLVDAEKVVPVVVATITVVPNHLIEVIIQRSWSLPAVCS